MATTPTDIIEEFRKRNRSPQFRQEINRSAILMSPILSSRKKSTREMKEQPSQTDFIIKKPEIAANKPESAPKKPEMVQKRK